jgi:hypothetical protein
VSHHRTGAWEPPTKDEDLLFEQDLAEPRRKRKNKKRR